MIVYYNNQKLDLMTFSKLLKNKTQDIDTVFHVGDDFSSIDILNLDRFPDGYKIIHNSSEEEIHRLYFNVLKLYYYETTDEPNFVREFLNDFKVFQNSIFNNFLDILKTKDEIMFKFQNTEYVDYICTIVDEGILNVDLDLPWISIFYYADADLDIYPYPIRIVELETIIQEYDLSSDDIFINEYTGYYIIKNLDKNSMFHIKLSLPEKFKVITSYDKE